MKQAPGFEAAYIGTCHGANYARWPWFMRPTVKILKFGTPQTIAITVLKIEKFDVTLH